MQPSDISRTLIQQGGGRGWGRQLQQQHDSVVVVEKCGFQQGFAKHYEGRGCGEVGLRRERETRVFGSPKTPTIYRRRGGGCAPSRVPTLGGAAALDGTGGGGQEGERGGAP